jgi:hypothetical protein
VVGIPRSAHERAAARRRRKPGTEQPRARPPWRQRQMASLRGSSLRPHLALELLERLHPAGDADVVACAGPEGVGPEGQG